MIGDSWRRHPVYNHDGSVKSNVGNTNPLARATMFAAVLFPY